MENNGVHTQVEGDEAGNSRMTARVGSPYWDSKCASNAAIAMIGGDPKIALEEIIVWMQDGMPIVLYKGLYYGGCAGVEMEGPCGTWHYEVI